MMNLTPCGPAPSDQLITSDLARQMRRIAIGLAAACLVACGGGETDTRGAESFVLSDMVSVARRASDSRLPIIQERKRALAEPTETVDPLDAAVQLLDFGEANLREYFPGPETNRLVDDWVYRYYPATGVYLAVIGGKVLVFGGPFGPEVRNVGPLTTYITPRRMRPVAQVGNEQNVLVGSLLLLDGSRSTDPNFDTLTYTWTLTRKPEGSNAALTTSKEALANLRPDVVGTYEATLVVSDGRLPSEPAKVTINVGAANVAPVADAGSEQNVSVGTEVSLNGSASSDANGDALTYSWEFTTRPANSTAVLSGADSAAPRFTPDKAGSYGLRLVVNDGKVSSNAATVTVNATIANSAPQASAGAAQAVRPGASVTLDGSASRDADGDPLTYTWTLTSRPAGSSAGLTSPTSARPQFTADLSGTYVVSLVVSDGHTSSATATVTVTASASSNAGPVIGATTTTSTSFDYNSLGQLIGATTSITISATDSDGDSLTYSWTASSGSISGNGPTATWRRSISFGRPASGSVTVTVTDGRGGSTSKTINFN